MSLVCLCENIVLDMLHFVLHVLFFPQHTLLWLHRQRLLKQLSDCNASKWAPSCQTMCMHTNLHTVSLVCHTASTGMAARQTQVGPTVTVRSCMSKIKTYPTSMCVCVSGFWSAPAIKILLLYFCLHTSYVWNTILKYRFSVISPIGTAQHSSQCRQYRNRAPPSDKTNAIKTCPQHALPLNHWQLGSSTPWHCRIKGVKENQWNDGQRLKKDISLLNVLLDARLDSIMMDLINNHLSSESSLSYSIICV